MNAAPTYVFERRKNVPMKSPEERARKAFAMVLNRMSDTTQKAVAVALGVSEPTVTRMKEPKDGANSSEIERVLLVLTHLGLRIVDESKHCVAREQYEFLVKTHTRIAAKAPHLIWDEEDQ